MIDSTNLRNAVTIEAIRGHQRALQRIADRNGGTRASGTPGYGASARYIVSQIPTGAYGITRQIFQFPFYEALSDAELEQTAPGSAPYTFDEDFTYMQYSGSAPASVSGRTVEVHLVLPPGPDPSSSTSGCEASDFAGFPAGGIALIQRGTCDFAVKAANAQAAGAAAAIIFNEGQPGPTELLAGTLGGPVVTIPVFGATFDLGNELAGISQPVTLFVRTEIISENRRTENVLAETRVGRPGRVVVVGAHLDSVTEGPGINDNGSGSAAILEIARQMANLQVRNRVRFAWWGAEESGLLGPEYYVSQLSRAELNRIDLNLNFDMLGSPNPGYFTYDGDQSTKVPRDEIVPRVPEGSAGIERLLVSYLGSAGKTAQDTGFDGRSDYDAFTLAGIPSGGLFAGAEENMNDEQAKLWNGRAGEPFDPNYHKATDTLEHIDKTALGIQGAGVGYAVGFYATDITGRTGMPPREERTRHTVEPK